MSLDSHTVLIVDDSPEDRGTFRRYLTRTGSHRYVVWEEDTAESALERLRNTIPDCILIDYSLPDMDGLEFLTMVRQEFASACAFVFVTGIGSEAVAARAIQGGAHEYLSKHTLTADFLAPTIDSAIEKHLMQQQLQAQREELHHKNAELQAANEALQMRARVLENMAEGVVIADQECIIQFTNAAFDRMFGYAPGELSGQHIAVVNDLPPEENQRMIASCLRELQVGGTYRGEFRNRTKAGVSFLTSAHISLLNLGDRIYSITVQEDITQRKAAEAQLRESEERMRLVLSAARVGIWIYDLVKQSIYWSPEHCEIFGVDSFDGKVETFQSFLHPEDREPLWRAFSRAVEACDRYDVEFRIERRDGSIRWCHCCGHAEYDAHGNPIRVFGTVQDSTASRQAQQVMEELNVRLQRAVAESNHRIKNNLQALVALIDIQKVEGSETVPLSAMERLRQHITTLSGLHDLLTADARAGDDVAATVSLRAALDRLVGILRSASGARRIDVLQSDDIRLSIKQTRTVALIVNEIVQNAVKHGGSGVDITATVTREIVRLQVCDDGPGFPAGFDPRIAANTGIELIESLGKWDLRGDIRYTNRPEGGAQVVLTFPLASGE